MGFDTCLLGHLETAYQLKRVSKFLVSSERVSPGHGWDYQALARTLSQKPGIYPREFATAIAKDYQAFYQKEGEKTTISVTDLEKVGERNAIDLGYFGDLLRQNPKLPKETRDLAAKMTQELRRSVETNLTTGVPAAQYQGLKIYFTWRLNKAYADPSHQFFGTQAWTDFLKAYDKAPSPGNMPSNPMPIPGFPGPGLPPM